MSLNLEYGWVMSWAIALEITCARIKHLKNCIDFVCLTNQPVRNMDTKIIIVYFRPCKYE